MLSILARVCWSSVFFGQMSIQIICPFLNQVFFFLVLSCVNSLYSLYLNPLLDIPFGNIFSHSADGIFIFSIVSFYMQKMQSHLFIFISLARGDISKEILLSPMQKGWLSMTCSGSFLVSGLTVKSLIHLEFIYVCGMREQSSVILLHVAVWFSQNRSLKRFSFPHCILLSLLLWINCPYKCGFISELSILFSSSVSVLSTVLYCFNYHSFVVEFEIREHDTSCFVLPSQDCFGYLGSSCFHQILELFVLVL